MSLKGGREAGRQAGREAGRQAGRLVEVGREGGEGGRLVEGGRKGGWGEREGGGREGVMIYTYSNIGMFNSNPMAPQFLNNNHVTYYVIT